MAHLHLRHYPIFYYRDFCALLSWEISWGAKSLLTASAESAGNMLNSSLQKKVLINSFGWPKIYFHIHL
jgi:hypothetical protein